MTINLIRINYFGGADSVSRFNQIHKMVITNAEQDQIEPEDLYLDFVVRKYRLLRIIFLTFT